MTLRARQVGVMVRADLVEPSEMQLLHHCTGHLWTVRVQQVALVHSARMAQLLIKQESGTCRNVRRYICVENGGRKCLAFNEQS